ncbi:MAG: hypothetical protein HKN14_10535 [Marinicaulis sp.]|nr:hypothetical protein [Marinicaulis sp.]
MTNKYILFPIAALGLIVSACEHTAAPEPEASAKPMVEAMVAETQGNSSNISIGIVNGAPKFVGESSVTCNPNGQCGNSSGISLNGISGDIDLSHFPAGDVALSISIGDDAYNAGWRFPSDPFQAVAMIIYPQTGPKPTPVFGAGSWPTAEFGAPAVSSDLKTLTFTDKDDDTETYEYSVAINGPSGRVVLDPKVQNGGVGNR